MNRIFKVLFNAATGQFQVCSELSRLNKSGSHSTAVATLNRLSPSSSRIPAPRGLNSAVQKALLAGMVLLNLSYSTGALAQSSVSVGNTLYYNNASSITQLNASSATIGTLSNTGEINLPATAPSGVNAFTANNSTIGTISNTGTISSEYNGDNFAVNLNQSNVDTFVNDGLISLANGFSYDAAIYGYSSTIGSLINGTSGTISGDAYGVELGNSDLGLLQNAGTISVTGLDALYLYGASIGTIDNSGIIRAEYYGIDNNTIGTINNTGEIGGVINQGTIGLINNEAGGSIVGGEGGIYNDGSNIGTIDNSGQIGSANSSILGPGVANFYNASINYINNASGGLITGPNPGIDNNESAINVINNAGTISGSSFGIVNISPSFSYQVYAAVPGNYSNTSATINTIINEAGGSIIGTDAGIYSDNAFLGEINNAGLISGDTGIYINNDSEPLTIINTGTISSTDNGNAIYINDPSATANISLGTGSNIQGTIDANNTATNILLSGQSSFDSNIYAPNGQVTLENGGIWNTTGYWQVGSVTNDGNMTIGTSNDLPGTLQITGNYTQGSNGTLNMYITPNTQVPGTDYSVLEVGGNASLAGNMNIDNIGNFVLADGGNQYDLIYTNGSVTGQFASINYDNQFASYITPSIYYGSDYVILKLVTPQPTQTITNTVTTTINNTVTTTLVNTVTTTINNTLTTTLDRTLTTSIEKTILRTISLQSAPTNPTGASAPKVFSTDYAAVNTTANDETAVSKMTGSLLSASLDGSNGILTRNGTVQLSSLHRGAWGKAFGGFGNHNGFGTNNYGIVAGYGWRLTPRLIGGLSFNGGSANVNSYYQTANSKFFGPYLYGIYTHHHFRVSADFGGGFIQNSSERHLYPTNLTAHGTGTGWYLGTGVQMQYLIPLRSHFWVIPYGKMYYNHISEGTMTEYGAGLLDVTNAPTATNIFTFAAGDTANAGSLHDTVLQTTQYLGSNQAAFDVAPANTFDGGAGILIKGTHHAPWAVRFTYQGNWGHRYRNNEFALTAQYHW